LPSSIGTGPMAVIGAISSLLRVPARVCLLNPQPTLGLGSRDYSLSPKAVAHLVERLPLIAVWRTRGAATKIDRAGWIAEIRTRARSRTPNRITGHCQTERERSLERGFYDYQSINNRDGAAFSGLRVLGRRPQRRSCAESIRNSVFIFVWGCLARMETHP
jgi:hypothetical protein